MSKLNRSIWLCLFCLVCLRAEVGYGDTPTLKVGALLCATGACADVGQAALEGVTLAVEEINAQGGVLGRQLSISAEDSKDGDSPVNAAHGALDGTIFAGFATGSGDFGKKFSQRFGHAPGMSADTGYDSIVLLKRAAERVGSLEPMALLDAMLIDSWDGASGTIHFDAHGGVQKEPRFFKIAGEQFENFDG